MGLVFRISGLGLRALDFGFRVQGLGFSFLGSADPVLARMPTCPIVLIIQGTETVSH